MRSYLRRCFDNILSADILDEKEVTQSPLPLRTGSGQESSMFHHSVALKVMDWFGKEERCFSSNAFDL
jgi:hypothetical protein